MAYYHHYHAEKHQSSHQAYAQADGCQAQLVIGLPVYVGAGGVGWRHIVGLALGAAVMGRADAGRLAFCSNGAGPAVQTRLWGTAVCWLVTVAAGVPWGAGTRVVVDAVDAGGAVCARVPGTFVDIDLTAQTCEARAAAAQSHVTVEHTMATYAKAQTVT